MNEFGNIKSRSIQMIGEIKASRRRLDELENQLKGKVAKLDSLKDNIAIQAEAVEILKDVIEKRSENHLQKLKDLLTLALNTIFPDREYGIEIEIDDKRGMSNASFYLLEKVGDEIIRSPLEGGTGGSIRAIIGFVLQVFYIRYFKMSNVMFLDEAFGSISEAYIPSLMGFMKQLSNLKDFKFIMISHDNRIIAHADRVYQVDAGGAILVEHPKHEAS